MYCRMTMDVRRRELSQADAGEMSGVMDSIGEGFYTLTHTPLHPHTHTPTHNII